jgi:hypothetical protein
MPNFMSEDQIEVALVQKLQHLHGFDSINCHTEDPEDLNDNSGRMVERRELQRGEGEWEQIVAARPLPGKP